MACAQARSTHFSALSHPAPAPTTASTSGELSVVVKSTSNGIVRWRTRVGRVDAADLTVRQVVRYYANVEGGVHFGIPKEDGQHTINEMAPVLLGNTTGQIEILGHLGQIVVQALTPLCDSILTAPTIISAMHQLNSSGFYDHHWTAEHYAKRRPKTPT
jgi:hypothetical protein